MRVVILTEGGMNFGMGHITRSISLFQAFQNRKIIPKLIINGQIKTRAIIKGVKFKLFNWAKNKKNLLSSIKSAEIVIVDSYTAEEWIYKIISSQIKIPVFIDDFKRLNYPRGIIVSPSAYGHLIKYSKNIYFHNLLGPKFVILRKEFWNCEHKLINKNIKNIMFTFGGEDLKNTAPKIIKFLDKNFPHFNKIVVTGKNYLKKNGKMVQIVYHPQAQKMKDVMLKSDLAISAGGQTLYELARIGIPTIGICTANNQELNLESLKKNRFIEYVGRGSSKRFFLNLSIALQKLMDYKVRLRHSEKGRKMIDGKGSVRVVESLLNLSALELERKK